jgi:hypothetical protein
MRFQLVAVSFALIISVSTASAQGAMQVAPSGRGSSEVVITFVDSAARAAATPLKIKIDYGQPSLRGRQILTDSLVPYDKPWRTGANALTTLTSDVRSHSGREGFSERVVRFLHATEQSGMEAHSAKESGSDSDRRACTLRFRE